MKIALIGDIHGNYAALQVVLNAIDARGITKILVTGDLVGYYYEPGLVLDLIRQRQCQLVKGNHEDLLMEALQSSERRREIKAKYGRGIEYAIDQLEEADIQYLEAAERSIELDLDGLSLLLAHGSPWDTDVYIYPDADDEVWQRVAETGVDVVVMGHTHYQFDRRVDKTLIVNPGSVGQPRDRRPGAAWSMFDTETGAVEHFREPYDISSVTAQAKLIDPDLPYLADVLVRT